MTGDTGLGAGAARLGRGGGVTCCRKALGWGRGGPGASRGGRAVPRCDRLRKVDWRGQMSSWVADSLASVEERSWREDRRSLFSLRISASWLVMVSSWVVMATMPEAVAHRMERVEPSPAVMVWRA